MPIDLDGIAVLNAISKRPDSFPTASDDINELARKTFEKRLDPKGLTLDLLRDIAALVDETNLLQVFDSLSPAKIGKLAKKLDKEKPDLAEAGAQANCQHLLALATGKAEPTPKPAKPAKAGSSGRARKPAAPKRKVKRTLSSKAMTASYGGRHSKDES